MKPEETATILSRAASDLADFPWWAYLLALILSFLGGFLGAYAKKKGEALATKEDFDALLKQVKETTIVAESIKVNLATGSWLHQQEWYLKEKYYSGLLDSLYRFKQSVLARLDYYIDPGSEYRDQEIEKEEHFKRQLFIGSEAFNDLHRLYGPAEMVISERAVNILKKFYGAQWHASNFSVCSKEYLNDVYKAVEEAHQVVLQEARTELRSGNT